jgi:glycosyltransferase involved in cell wall biosynthesis
MSSSASSQTAYHGSSTFFTSAIFISPRNPTQLREALIKMLNSSTREKMKGIGPKLIEENFTWEKIVKKYVKIYEEI